MYVKPVVISTLVNFVNYMTFFYLIARKKPPPRPSPPKVAPVANVSREDAILAHLRPEAGKYY